MVMLNRLTGCFNLVPNGYVCIWKPVMELMTLKLFPKYAEDNA